jgi:hypothetical protein
MAAVIIPLVTAAVGAISPHIGEIAQFVEGLFGHSSVSGTKDGPIKMETAVSMLTVALQQLANAGRIPSTPVMDPSLPAGLAGAVQQAVDALKAQGLLGGPTAVQPSTKPAPAAITSQPAGPSVAGMKVTITGLMMSGEAAL